MKSALAKLLNRVNQSHSVSELTDILRLDRVGSVELSAANDFSLEEGRARKRVKLSSDHESPQTPSLAQIFRLRIDSMLVEQETSMTDGLSEVAP